MKKLFNFSFVMLALLGIVACGMPIVEKPDGFDPGNRKAVQNEADAYKVLGELSYDFNSALEQLQTELLKEGSPFSSEWHANNEDPKNESAKCNIENKKYTALGCNLDFTKFILQSSYKESGGGSTSTPYTAEDKLILNLNGKFDAKTLKDIPVKDFIKYDSEAGEDIYSDPRPNKIAAMGINVSADIDYTTKEVDFHTTTSGKGNIPFCKMKMLFKNDSHAGFLTIDVTDIKIDDFGFMDKIGEKMDPDKDEADYDETEKAFQKYFEKLFYDPESGDPEPPSLTPAEKETLKTFLNGFGLTGNVKIKFYDTNKINEFTLLDTKDFADCFFFFTNVMKNMPKG